MSHRLTIETQMTDLEAARDALNNAKVAFSEVGNLLHLQTDPYKGSTLDLKTGTLRSGDVDFNRIDQGKLGILRQYYAEAKYRKECFMEGVEITERQEQVIDGKKVIVLGWRAG